ncbi:manganese transport system ATP-binding protein [Pseudoclavibacter sp. JAI123]|uniref:metal ABC transporter ATP-binding protein n=1 Tax=Pseudoclavibacter sp. JAI123 TaxID=2723065 RepID=UPI0015CCC05E|nr:metal ABC transporter ATP-binding protein [Pseudoclavibacter sp. JAI123]NYF14965.1 manganese transport system ATP-binding protein [Pseudoclavibacter sp. JAI123]
MSPRSNGAPAGTTTSPAIEVDALTVHYGEVLALDGATLAISPGRVCGLIGMNGSGKSTLFKSIMGVVRPDAGTVRILGGTSADARKRGSVSYVPQSEQVDWDFPLSVRDVVMTGRYGHLGVTRRPKARDHAAVDAALERVELSDLAGRQIGQLSGGQRKRAFVARGIAQEAQVLLLDEPFAGVDTRSQATMTRLLRELAAQGVCILIATHDLGSLPELADEAVLFNRRVLLHASPEEIIRPENLALAFGIDTGKGAAA